MPNPLDALKQPAARLTAFTAVAAAGALSSAYLAATGDSQGAAALGTGLAAAGTNALGSLATNIVSTDVHVLLAERLGQSKELLRNHDLARAVGDAMAVVIRAAADEPVGAADRGDLLRLAERLPDRWVRMTRSAEVVPAPLTEPELTRLFSAVPGAAEAVQPLAAAEWHGLLDRLARETPEAAYRDVYLSEETWQLLAGKLHTTFTWSLREVLKHDFSRGGKAYAGMLLLLLGEIAGTCQEAAENSREIRAEMAGIEARMSAAAVEAARRIIDRLDQVERIRLAPVIRYLEQLDGRLADLEARLTDRLEVTSGRIRDEGQRTRGHLEEQLQEVRAQIVGDVAAELEQRLERAPPAPPSAWNLPPRSLLFTGRAEILEQVETHLTRTGAVALHGMPGVGKTQTALAYAHQHQSRYPYAFWVNADSVFSLTAGFVAMARLLDLPLKNERDQGLVVDAAKRWLGSHSGWLLLLDNADEPPVALEFLPSGGEGHVLLTTRAPAVGGHFHPVAIEKMSHDEGARFLLRRARRLTEDTPLEAAGEADRTAALALSRELDGLPLALDQAGAFMEETRSAPAEYLELYRTRGKELRGERGRLGARDHDSVTGTFSLAFRQVEQASAAAADLLRLCGFLAPDGIPEEILTAGALDLGDPLGPAAADPLDRIRMIREASRFSLLRRDPDPPALTIHRVVQEVLRDGMDPAAQRRWAERAVRAVQRAFPAPEFSSWTLCERLLPHARVCVRHVEERGMRFVEAGTLSYAAASYLQERARYEEAEPLYGYARAILEEILGPRHPETAECLNKLAELYRAQGRYEDAEPLYAQALEFKREALGPAHPDVGAVLNNRAQLRYAQARYAEAEALYEQAREILEGALGPVHPHVAAVLNNLGLLYQSLARYPEAERLLDRSLTIRKEALGPAHPDVGISLNNLALLYDAQRRYVEAEPLYQESLAITQKVMGPEHPDVAIRYNNLADLYRAQGRSAEAESLYGKARAILETALGPEHPYVAASLNNLAKLHDEQGHEAEAEPLYQRALSIMEGALGPDHPHTVRVRQNYAALLGRRQVTQS